MKKRIGKGTVKTSLSIKSLSVSLNAPAGTSKIAGECEMFATQPMRCPLCGIDVAANTWHHCKRVQ